MIVKPILRRSHFISKRSGAGTRVLELLNQPSTLLPPFESLKTPAAQILNPSQTSLSMERHAAVTLT
jgi:hypothetical protein